MYNVELHIVQFHPHIIGTICSTLLPSLSSSISQSKSEVSESDSNSDSLAHLHPHCLHLHPHCLLSQSPKFLEYPVYLCLSVKGQGMIDSDPRISREQHLDLPHWTATLCDCHTCSCEYMFIQEIREWSCKCATTAMHMIVLSFSLSSGMAHSGFEV